MFRILISRKPFSLSHTELNFMSDQLLPDWFLCFWVSNFTPNRCSPTSCQTAHSVGGEWFNLAWVSLLSVVFWCLFGHCDPSGITFQVVTSSKVVLATVSLFFVPVSLDRKSMLCVFVLTVQRSFWSYPAILSFSSSEIYSCWQMAPLKMT